MESGDVWGKREISLKYCVAADGSFGQGSSLNIEIGRLGK